MPGLHSVLVPQSAKILFLTLPRPDQYCPSSRLSFFSIKLVSADIRTRTARAKMRRESLGRRKERTINWDSLHQQSWSLGEEMFSIMAANVWTSRHNSLVITLINVVLVSDFKRVADIGEKYERVFNNFD